MFLPIETGYNIFREYYEDRNDYNIVSNLLVFNISSTNIIDRFLTLKEFAEKNPNLVEQNIENMYHNLNVAAFQDMQFAFIINIGTKQYLKSYRFLISNSI